MFFFIAFYIFLLTPLSRFWLHEYSKLIKKKFLCVCNSIAFLAHSINWSKLSINVIMTYFSCFISTLPPIRLRCGMSGNVERWLGVLHVQQGYSSRACGQGWPVSMFRECSVFYYNFEFLNLLLINIGGAFQWSFPCHLFH